MGGGEKNSKLMGGAGKKNSWVEEKKTNSWVEKKKTTHGWRRMKKNSWVEEKKKTHGQRRKKNKKKLIGGGE